jgi:hypothetical protein
MKKKRIGIMIYPEILDSLESLSNDEIGQMFRLIIKWNKGEEVIPQSSLEKFVWATIYPKLEENKNAYNEICEKRRDAVNKRWDKEKNTNEYKSILENSNSNYNYNSNNTSKDVLVDKGIEQQESPVGDSVVSKGLESLESIFPEKKRDIGINEINRWNTLLQPQKSNVIKKASLYIRSEKKNEGGKYIKKLSKWFNEEYDKGIAEELLPKKKPDSKQTFKYVDGNIYSILEQKLGSTKGIDYIYHILNTSGLSKEELTNTVKELNSEELLELAKS